MTTLSNTRKPYFPSMLDRGSDTEGKGGYRLPYAIAVTLLSTSMTLCFQPSSEASPAPTALFRIPSKSAGQIMGKNRNDLKALGRLRELAIYKDGWAGPDSFAASKKAIADAEIFIRAIDFQEILPPYISLAQDGEINFWWDFPGVRMDLGIFGDGTYVYYARLDALELADDGISVSQPLPENILNKLKKN